MEQENSIYIQAKKSMLKDLQKKMQKARTLKASQKGVVKDEAKNEDKDIPVPKENKKKAKKAPIADDIKDMVREFFTKDIKDKAKKALPNYVSRPKIKPNIQEKKKKKSSKKG